MRREHSKEQSYIDWLKSLGCVLYLPLSENGDLTDRISGLTIQLTGDGSMTWDSTQQMYKFKTPSSDYKQIGYVADELLPTDFAGGWTCLYTIGRITYSNTKALRALSFYGSTGNINSTNGFTPMWSGTGNTNRWPTGVHTVAYTGTANGNQRYLYQDGQLSSTSAAYDISVLPSDYSGIYIGRTDRAVVEGVEFYGKEWYLFNNALDLATIRKIQGYE